MAGVVGGDCRDKMADSCQGLIGKCSDFELYSVVNRKSTQ